MIILVKDYEVSTTRFILANNFNFGVSPVFGWRRARALVLILLLSEREQRMQFHGLFLQGDTLCVE